MNSLRERKKLNRAQYFTCPGGVGGGGILIHKLCGYVCCEGYGFEAV